MRLLFESADSVKQTALCNVGGPHPKCWRPEQEESGGKVEIPLCLFANEDISLQLLDWYLYSGSPDSLAFGLRLGIYHCVSWVSSLQIASIIM